MCGTSAWFDDIEITYTPDLITQEVHYDPWGLELVGIGETGNPECKWKFQNKELEDALGLFWQDFGARQYDAQLGRWHSLDPADQFASGYVGMGNNPPNGTDPDGTWFGVDDAIAAGIGFAVGYVSSGISTGDWGKRSLIAGGIGALTGWLAYNTGGLSMATSASGTAHLGQFAINQGLGAAASFLPTPSVQVGAFSFGLSPSFAMGSNGIGFGMNFSASAQIGDFTIGGSIGSMGFADGGSESRISGGGGWDNGTCGASYYLTRFGGSQAQTSGEIGLRHKEWGLRINNDFLPGADGGDRWRTGGGQLSRGDYSVGFAIKTGDPGLKSTDRIVDNVGGKAGTYTSGTSNDRNSRMGAIYAGYKNQRAGWSSDGIRACWGILFYLLKKYGILFRNSKRP